MKTLILGAAAATSLTLIGTAAAAHPYGYYRSYDRGYAYDYGRGYDYRHRYISPYRDSDRDGRPDYREWNRDRDRDGRPDQWDRYDNRRSHHRYRDHRRYYNGYGGGWGYGQPYMSFSYGYRY